MLGLNLQEKAQEWAWSFAACEETFPVELPYMLSVTEEAVLLSRLLSCGTPLKAAAVFLKAAFSLAWSTTLRCVSPHPSSLFAPLILLKNYDLLIEFSFSCLAIPPLSLEMFQAFTDPPLRKNS